MALTHIAIAIAVVLLAWPFIKIFNHHAAARKLGLPIVTSIVDPLQPLWAILGPVIFPLLTRLPYGIGDVTNCDKFKWSFQTRSKLHRQLGPAFTLVHPGGLRVMVADGHAVEDVFNRRKEFVKPDIYKILDVFGSNVDSLNGEEWQRHRKITSPPFNERNSNMVWVESLSQASQMLQSWLGVKEATIAALRADTTTLAIHVLTGAGFGKFYSFRGGASKPAEGHTMGFEESLHIVLNKFIAVALNASISFIPKRFSAVKTATAEFRQYLTEIVAEERATIKQRSSEKDNLMSALLRALDLREAKGEGRNTLSNDEIFGNLFIYTFAGHDTTANTLAYAVSLLAADNGVQSWLKEEVKSITAVYGDASNWDYAEVFPQLKRCLAVMYETLRLFGPVFMLPRVTDGTYQPLTIGGKEYMIPPGAFVMLNLLDTHTATEYWGSDSYTWRPARWIVKNGDSTGLEHEELLQPPGNAFLPWAYGPRICPGKKFAQVEFVAVMSRLFQNHRVNVVLKKGESTQQGHDRIHQVLEDSNVGLTLNISHPERAKIVWEQDA